MEWKIIALNFFYAVLGVALMFISYRAFDWLTPEVAFPGRAEEGQCCGFNLHRRHLRVERRITMLTKMHVFAATMLSLMIGGQSLSGQAGRWVYLGEANVDGGHDHDNIKVGGDEGRYRALQINVERAAIDFDRVVVHYDNGGDDTLPIRGRVPAGGKSRVIDLRGASGLSVPSRSGTAGETGVMTPNRSCACLGAAETTTVITHICH